MKFESLHFSSRYQTARNKDRFEIAFTLGAVAAIVFVLIGGSRLIVEMLAY